MRSNTYSKITFILSHIFLKITNRYKVPINSVTSGVIYSLLLHATVTVDVGRAPCYSYKWGSKKLMLHFITPLYESDKIDGQSLRLGS